MWEGGRHARHVRREGGRHARHVRGQDARAPFNPFAGRMPTLPSIQRLGVPAGARIARNVRKTRPCIQMQHDGARDRPFGA